MVISHEMELNDEVKYALIFPAGAVCLYTEKSLQKEIDDINKVIGTDDDPYYEAADSLATYEELRDLTELNTWTEVSGPYDKNCVLKGVIGIKYFN